MVLIHMIRPSKRHPLFPDSETLCHSADSLSPMVTDLLSTVRVRTDLQIWAFNNVLLFYSPPSASRLRPLLSSLVQFLFISSTFFSQMAIFLIPLFFPPLFFLSFLHPHFFCHHLTATSMVCCYSNPSVLPMRPSWGTNGSFFLVIVNA